MLQIQHIKKEYRTGTLVQKALDDVSLNLRDNEFVAILGPSGSGKTTLLNIIGGLDRYDSGDLIINGISTKKYKDRDWDSYRNHTIGFVFQSYNLIPHQTVLANVELALTISGVSKEVRRKKAIAALEKVGLGKQLHKRPSQMSGGQMQRVAIARALVNDPEILLADEPTGALDSDTSIQVMDLLQEVAKERLVVMVTHNPELAELYANRIVTLRDGVICSDTNPFEPDSETLLPPKHKNMGKSSMSFLTALSLSFNNLRTKKARTLLTSFAGSIGIIGIALILALSSGVNEYIQNMEEETLSEYPLQIQSTGFDLTSMMVGSQNAGKDSKDSGKKNEIKVQEVVTNMFSTMNSNDLASLKKYLDGGADGISDYTNAIEYSYSVTPQIRGSFPHSGAGRILSLQKKIQKSFERKQSRMDQNRMPLVEALQQFREEAPAYFRIPGHRFERGLDETLNGASLAAYDLSEAEGLDDLHHAEGVIAEAQKLAAETWKAKKTFFLVNGTTCGNEAMVLSSDRQPTDVFRLLYIPSLLRYGSGNHGLRPEVRFLPAVRCRFRRRS